MPPHFVCDKVQCAMCVAGGILATFCLRRSAVCVAVGISTMAGAPACPKIFPGKLSALCSYLLVTIGRSAWFTWIFLLFYILSFDISWYFIYISCSKIFLGKLSTLCSGRCCWSPAGAGSLGAPLHWAPGLICMNIFNFVYLKKHIYGTFNFWIFAWVPGRQVHQTIVLGSRHDTYLHDRYLHICLIHICVNILYFICGSSGHFVGYSKTTVYHDLQGMKYRHKPVVHSTFMIENNLGRGCTGICWRNEGMGALQMVGSANGYMSFVTLEELPTPRWSLLMQGEKQGVFKCKVCGRSWGWGARVN